MADRSGHIYDVLEDKSRVLEIDPCSLKIIHRWSVAPGQHPAGLSMDRRHRLLFCGRRNGKMVVLSADTGTVLACLPIGQGVDATRFDPVTSLAFSSNRDGTIRSFAAGPPGSALSPSQYRARHVHLAGVRPGIKQGHLAIVGAASGAHRKGDESATVWEGVGHEA